MTTTTTIGQMLRSLSASYRGVNSLTRFDKSTLDTISEYIDADLYLLAAHGNGGVRPMATLPPNWTDSDALLTPVSPPVCAISKEKSWVFDDLSDVRSASASDVPMDSSTNEYRSVAVTPFGDESMLLVASHSPGQFDKSDLETLQVISSFAAPLRSQLLSEGTNDKESIVGDAAAVLSHDAGNVLTIILGHLDLAREDPKEQHFQAIERGSERLIELIDDTTTILRTGSQVNEYERVFLRDVANAAWNTIDTADARLVHDESGTILAHESSLCELLENVFRNAVEHAGSEVTVTIGVLETNDGFYVEDDGPGIEPDQMDSLFDVRHSTSREDEGLGLTIVKRIVEAHGWEISAQNGEMGGLRLEFHAVDVVD